MQRFSPRPVTASSALVLAHPILVSIRVRARARRTAADARTQRAVCKEALRLSHGVYTPMLRVVPRGGATLDGRFVPGGVSALLSLCDGAC